MTSEDRLVDIEIRIARHEDTLDALNELVFRQQKKIDELEALCSALARHMKDMRDASNEGASAHEKPPHY
jgi:SlyX protein